MQLIVRVTSRCNFKCSFCSASNISKTIDLPYNTLIDFATRYQDSANSIVFEGGDPLCIKPEYYQKFLQWKDDNPKLKDTTVSFTSNLWDFYKRPEKWVDIFKREDVDVGTSFQYGDARRLTVKKPYTERMFIDVFNKYVQLVGKRPGFISVIDSTNENTIVNTVLLAKRLETSCKINPLFESGRSTSFYPWDKMMLHYAKLFELGLDSYEMNCVMIRGIITNHPEYSGCPLYSRQCDNDYRVISPDGFIKTCSMDQNSINELGESVIQLYKDHKVSNILDNKKIRLASSDCLTCDYYRWCNYCRIKIRQYHNTENKQQYCANIKAAIDRIKKVVLDNA